MAELEKLTEQTNVSCQNFNCETTRRYLSQISELLYLRQIFNESYRKILDVLGIEYEEDPKFKVVRRTQTSRAKRGAHLISPYMDVADLKVLIEFDKQLTKFVKKQKSIPTRTKRFGVLNLLFGWGVSLVGGLVGGGSVSQSVIDNINLLQENDELQDKKIKELANFINITMRHVNINQQAIEHLDLKILSLQQALHRTIHELAFVRQNWLISSTLQNSITRLQTGLESLRHNSDHIFDIVSTMSTQKITPVVIPRRDLTKLLVRVQQDLETVTHESFSPQTPNPTFGVIMT